MDAPSHSEKKQNIMMSLPLLAFWIGGLWTVCQTGSSTTAGAAVTAWYLLLALIFLELGCVRTDGHASFYPVALSFLWGLGTGLTGSRPLPALLPFLNRIPAGPVGSLAAILTAILLLLLFLTFKKKQPVHFRRYTLPAAALSLAACIWEPARYTLSLCLLADGLYQTAHGIAQNRDGMRRALSEVEVLSELNRMKNQSYADLSHEMKTPLTVISVNAQLAAKTLESGLPDEETVTDIRIISSEASRLTQMVTSLAGLGGLQGSGTGCTLLALDELASATARTFRPLAARYGNSLTVTAEPDLPPVSCNADRLIQVLINLITNANRHTRNGCIAISIKSLFGGIEVSVTDSGEGIDPALLPHVFERFCHGDKGNTGLGLTICKKIIEDHGGEIGIESEVGKGTRVWFTLPTA